LLVWPVRHRLVRFATLLVLVAGNASAARNASNTGTSSPPTSAPLYYDRPMERGDLAERSTEELRLMRNTIYARAGREFKDRDLRAYFGKQPWYRSTATPAKLSPLDEKNLARIKNWEPLAKAREDLRALVPAWGANVKLPPRADCEADDKGVLSDGKLARRLATLLDRLTWAEVDPYDDRPWPVSVTKRAQVRLLCLPDLDGDGAPESVVWIRRDYGEPHDDSVARVFVVSGKGPAWRAIAPLGVDGTCPGVEGSRSTNVLVVRLADGRPAFAVETMSGGGGDCDEPIEKVSVFTLKRNKLVPVGSFTTSAPTCVD
jgi:hypothetical protein